MKQADLSGRQFDEYLLETLLGQGGMAQVYRAIDVRLKRYVAIKVIIADHGDDATYQTRFEREAQAIAQLQHPNIVGLYRYGDAAGMPYMAMQYVEGADLQFVLHTYREDGEFMEPEVIQQICGEVCRALDFAHDKGVIHRDIKPSNILLDKSGQAYLSDFGLVLLEGVGTRGEIMGSPHYIAPEQAVSSARAVAQSDLYAVGVMLYEMFTGDLPFDAPDPMDVALLHISQPPPPPRSLRPELSPAVEAVILKALAKTPPERYQSGAALTAALDTALKQAALADPTTPARTSIMQRVDLELARHPLPPLPAEIPLPPPETATPPLADMPSTAEWPTAADRPAAVDRSATAEWPAAIDEPVTAEWPAAADRPAAVEALPADEAMLEVPAPPAASGRSRRTLLLLGGTVLAAIVCLALLSLGYLSRGFFNGDDETATAAAIISYPAVTATGELTSTQAYPGPAATGTITATAGGDDTTAYPGPVAATATAAASPTTAPPPPPQTFVYSLRIVRNLGEGLVIINESSQPLALSELRLKRGNNEIEGSEWAIAALGPGQCVAARSGNNGELPDVTCPFAPDAPIISGRGGGLWRDKLTIFYDGEEVGECAKDEELCVITIEATIVVVPGDFNRYLPIIQRP